MYYRAAITTTVPADISTSVQFDPVSLANTPSPDPSAVGGVAGELFLLILTCSNRHCYTPVKQLLLEPAVGLSSPMKSTHGPPSQNPPPQPALPPLSPLSSS